jgi:chromate transporter
MLSLMSVGGAISTTSEMHRYLVEQHHWLTQAQFNESIALAQAAPGPNVLFVALMGWHVGLNAGSMAAALLGVAVTMIRHHAAIDRADLCRSPVGPPQPRLRAVRAFKQGMAPVVIALLLSTSWILGSAAAMRAKDWPLWLLSLAAASSCGAPRCICCGCWPAARCWGGSSWSKVFIFGVTHA